MRSCGKNPKDRQKYGRSFDERVELTRRTAISKIEANIPVYDAKGEEKMWKSCRPCFRKCQTDSVSLDGIITDGAGKMARKEFRQGEKE